MSLRGMQESGTRVHAEVSQNRQWSCKDTEIHTSSGKEEHASSSLAQKEHARCVEANLRRRQYKRKERVMCNFLRRPTDYGGTQATGFMANVSIDSSVPNAIVSYTSALPARSHSEIALRTFVATHQDQIENLRDSNPELHALLTAFIAEESSGL